MPFFTPPAPRRLALVVVLSASAPAARSQTMEPPQPPTVADLVRLVEGQRSLLDEQANFDFRTPSGVGQLRAFVEADFAAMWGSARAFRLLLRQLRGAPPEVPRSADRDYITFATNAGHGIGRYITDLGTLGGQDAIYDPATNTLEALPVASAYQYQLGGIFRL